MDPKAYRESLFSRAYFRDRLLWLCALALGFTAAERLGLLHALEPGIPGRARVAVLVTTVTVAMWLVAGVLGAIGLYRWLRA